MNIIIDKILNDYLQSLITDTVEFGSRMKGATEVTSDSDLLHIIREPRILNCNTMFTNHQLQFKEFGDLGYTDHIYCTTKQFVSNLINAESAIPYEVLSYDKLTNTSLFWLNAYKNEFKNFQTARCFLGLGRRDMHEAAKLFKNDYRNCNKKLKFTIEGLGYVCDILKHHGLIQSGCELTNILTTFSPQSSYTEFESIVHKINYFIEHFRKLLQQTLEQNKIPRSISPELYELCSNMIYHSARVLHVNEFDSILNSLYYNANINNVYK